MCGVLVPLAQLAILLPMLGLVPRLLSTLPGTREPADHVAGRWISCPEEYWGTSPALCLELGCDGAFDLRAATEPHGRRCLHASGEYRVHRGHLILGIPGQTVVWQMARRGPDLVLTTTRGDAIRLQRCQQE